MFASTLSIKKATLFLSALASIFLMLAPNVSATDLNSTNDLCTGSNLTVQDNAGCGKKIDPSTGKPVDEAPGDTATSKFALITKDIIDLLSIIAGIAAVIMVMYGGFRLLASGGNPESTKSGRNAILYALIGIVIIAFAQTIVKLVLNRFV